MADRKTRSYAGRTVLVVGAARSGIAAAEFLLARGARVVLTDAREQAALGPGLKAIADGPGRERLRLELGVHRPESFSGCDLVVVSPGVPLGMEHFERSRASGIPIISEVELAYRHLNGMIIGITGSNGKTTTTTLVAEILSRAGLRARAAGNIGYPLIRAAEASADEDIHAVELSSFQLESIHEFRPRIGAVLNITPNHLDRYEGFEAYAAAKERLFMNQDAGDFAVLNADDARTAAIAGRVRSAPVFFSRTAEAADGAFMRGETAVYRRAGEEIPLFERRDLALRGEHNLENALAAAAMALLAGAGPEAVRETVREFRGVEHRLEWVAEIGGVQYYNDSKATSVDAAVKSLESFPGSIRLILGGRDKGGDFAPLRTLVKQKCVGLVLLGEAAGKIRGALEGTVDTAEVATLPEAVELCHRRGRPGEIVLLAPACASFDMFENYEHRGRVFKEAVLGLRPES